MSRLLDTIKRIRRKVSKYRDALKSSEALTRYVLVDPLLNALGWNTDNPEKVRPEEIQKDGKRPDYVLYVDGRKMIALEVKSLESNIDEDAILRYVSDYCLKSGIPYFIMTDGDIWVTYSIETVGSKKTFYELFRFGIVRDDIADIEKKLQALMHKSVARHQKIQLLPQPREKEVAKPREVKVTEPAIEELDIEKVREFYNSLTPGEKALIEIVFKAWREGKILRKSEIINEMKKRGIYVDKVGFTGIKSGITRKSKSFKLPCPLPSSEEVGKEYWRDESKRYKLRDGWGRALERILATK